MNPMLVFEASAGVFSMDLVKRGWRNDSESEIGPHTLLFRRFGEAGLLENSYSSQSLNKP